MLRRAEQVRQTRQRIVDAAVHLHGTVGPAATTIAGIADRAGVTRLTVYRHFPDEDTLFAACSQHWMSQQVPPDTAAWTRIDNPEERLRHGLADLYRFYRQGEPMLTCVYRDKDFLPESVRRNLDSDSAHYRDVLLKPFTQAGADRRRSRALLGHAVSFWTWHSLCKKQRLSDREAANAMTALLVANAKQPSPQGQPVGQPVRSAKEA